MSKYDRYLKELEDLSSYTESEDFAPDQYLIKLYDLYKNGNFLAINIIAGICKTLYKTFDDKSYLDLPLNIFLAGPTNVLDLDFEDQNNLLLHKGEFLTYYALNVDESYKDLALETLNYYADTNSDGRHLKAKALLNKPKSEDDTLQMEYYKNLLLEYFAYGNELDEEELKVVNIPSSYLSLDKEGLFALVKENKNNNEVLKKLYYVLINKGFISYACELAEIDNTFILDYYQNKVDPYGYKINKAWMKKSSKAPLKNDNRFKIIFILDIIFLIIDLIVPSAIFHDFIFGFHSYFFLIMFIVFLLDPLILLLGRKSKLLSIIFSALSAIKTSFFLVGCILEYGMAPDVIFFVILNIACIIAGSINAYRNKFNPKKNRVKLEEQEDQTSYGTSYFDGGLLQLIGYKILGNIIIFATFGIGYPWGKCFVEKWSVKHQVIDDDNRLSFNGNGLQLFGKYIIWLLLTIITFGIYGLWLSIKMKKWEVSHTHFVNEEASKTDTNTSSTNEIKTIEEEPKTDDTWTCSKCGTSGNLKKFCKKCGQKKDDGTWICPDCNNVNDGDFCEECGKKKPE